MLFFLSSGWMNQVFIVTMFTVLKCQRKQTFDEVLLVVFFGGYGVLMKWHSWVVSETYCWLLISFVVCDWFVLISVAVSQTHTSTDNIGHETQTQTCHYNETHVHTHDFISWFAITWLCSLWKSADAHKYASMAL